ncbi:pentapeptide repeat-containing protein [Cellulomonas chengniuliangii]|uniref:Pentapeptide repeat-containing protein n=1 Tax=Cellulomonas chengniuliangii TaxID=2968084 RepID=A0ABY5L5D7_9CELL|nr:pentapeptide repeat-containing protein [Cellulomonas chengniuliangii]MCC2309174.1 pentapeptide repeat-containing protein [Cellulomonas chengniuliangii]UUI77058.1 pentapeptide repeat-containing protein [Cellulomonas chengniuliangii]
MTRWCDLARCRCVRCAEPPCKVTSTPPVRSDGLDRGTRRHHGQRNAGESSEWSSQEAHFAGGSRSSRLGIAHQASHRLLDEWALHRSSRLGRPARGGVEARGHCSPRRGRGPEAGPHKRSFLARSPAQLVDVDGERESVRRNSPPKPRRTRSDPRGRNPSAHRLSEFEGGGRNADLWTKAQGQAPARTLVEGRTPDPVSQRATVEPLACGSSAGLSVAANQGPRPTGRAHDRGSAQGSRRRRPPRPPRPARRLRELRWPLLCGPRVLPVVGLRDRQARRPPLPEPPARLPVRHPQRARPARVPWLHGVRLLWRRAEGGPDGVRRARLARGPGGRAADVRGVARRPTAARAAVAPRRGTCPGPARGPARRARRGRGADRRADPAGPGGARGRRARGRVPEGEPAAAAGQRARARAGPTARRRPEGRAAHGREPAGGDLRGTSLRGARLVGADLRAADLRLADLRLADLTGADLRGADLRGVDLSTALFVTQAQLDSARGDASTRIPAARVLPARWTRPAVAVRLDPPRGQRRKPTR